MKSYLFKRRCRQCGRYRWVREYRALKTGKRSKVCKRCATVACTRYRRHLNKVKE